MSHNVKREERLKVKVVLRFPDVNAGKSYSSDLRAYVLTVDGVESPLASEIFRLRSKIVVKKMFGTKIVDSTFEYRVGENFATLQVGKYAEKKIAVDFSKGNILNVLDDSSYVPHSKILL